jgi:hypothetical protein
MGLRPIALHLPLVDAPLGVVVLCGELPHAHRELLTVHRAEPGAGRGPGGSKATSAGAAAFTYLSLP